MIFYKTNTSFLHSVSLLYSSQTEKAMKKISMTLSIYAYAEEITVDLLRPDPMQFHEPVPLCLTLQHRPFYLHLLLHHIS